MMPSSFMFMMTLVTGTAIALSSSNWLFLWMGMELNLLSFIPIIATSQKMQETEASVKYFIIQAIGSGLMLTAGIMSINPISVYKFSDLINLIFFFSMVIKLGMAPSHQWLPHVMSSISWTHCMVLATWQKVSPLIMLLYITPQILSPVMMAIAALSAIVGGIGGLNQSQLRALLAYSSIGHMGWMVTTIFISPHMFFLYFSIYMLISISMMIMLIKSFTLMSKLSQSMMALNPTMFMMMILALLSLGGLPPFLGFFPKWLVIFNLSSCHLFTFMMLLITGSLMNLFYYFNMTFNFIMSNPHHSWSFPPLSSIFFTSMITLSPIILIL